MDIVTYVTIIATRRCGAGSGHVGLAGGKEPQHGSLAGNWQIEPSSSQYKGRAPLQSGTMRFETAANGIHVVCTTAKRTSDPCRQDHRGTSTMTLAADGKSFTAVSQRSAPKDGHLYTSTIVWKRVAGS